MDHSRPALRQTSGRGERRAHPRLRLRAEAAFEDAFGTLFLPVEDLSAGGLGLRGRVEAPVGAPVRVVLELPGEPALQRLAGRVVRVERGAPGRVGVAFEPGAATARLGLAIERCLAWRRAS